MPALAALPILALLIGIGALIFVQLAPRITEGLFQSRGGFVAILTAPLRLIGAVGGTVVHHLINAMSPAIARPQQMIGAALHDDANLVRRLRAVLIGQALVVVGLAQALRGHVSAADLKAVEAGLTKRVGNAERQARGIGADVQPQIRGAVRGIEAGVNTRLGSLDREIGRIETKELPAIRAREKSLEHGASHTWEWIRRHPFSVVTTAFAGAVAVALARIGGSWIRCNPFQQNSKALCRSHPGWWEDLLAGAIAIVGTVSVVEFVRDAQAVEKDALDALAFFIREMPKA